MCSIFVSTIFVHNSSYIKFGRILLHLKTKIYGNLVLPVALHGCEIWSLTLREERRLRVFENRVLGRIFGPKRDEETREWRRRYNEELNDLYTHPILCG
jgi:hypothetical protein